MELESRRKSATDWLMNLDHHARLQDSVRGAAAPIRGTTNPCACAGCTVGSRKESYLTESLWIFEEVLRITCCGLAIIEQDISNQIKNHNPEGAGGGPDVHRDPPALHRCARRPAHERAYTPCCPPALHLLQLALGDAKLRCPAGLDPPLPYSSPCRVDEVRAWRARAVAVFAPRWLELAACARTS
jgi:hypothetical protein